MTINTTTFFAGVMALFLTACSSMSNPDMRDYPYGYQENYTRKAIQTWSTELASSSYQQVGLAKALGMRDNESVVYTSTTLKNSNNEEVEVSYFKEKGQELVINITPITVPFKKGTFYSENSLYTEVIAEISKIVANSTKVHLRVINIDILGMADKPGFSSAATVKSLFGWSSLDVDESYAPLYNKNKERIFKKFYVGMKMTNEVLAQLRAISAYRVITAAMDPEVKRFTKYRLHSKVYKHIGAKYRGVKISISYSQADKG